MDNSGEASCQLGIRQETGQRIRPE